MSDSKPCPVLAVVGGTGKEGSAIAKRFANAGIRTLIGSRDALRAQNTANTINASLGTKFAEGYSNCEAASKAEVIALVLPYHCILGMCEELKDCVQGKIVINIASSLDPEKKSRAKINPKGSITKEIQDYYGETTKVVAAFQNVSPEQLEKFDEKIETDVLVAGADREARNTVIEMIKQIGVDAFDAGAIQNAVVVETLTAALIAINIRYKVRGAGIRIVGVPRD
jgi:NADPH-dependent F420 reductase